MSPAPSTTLPRPRVGSAPAEREATRDAEQAVPDHAWRTIVWDDPVNLMTYVTYVFQSYFGYDEAVATRLMMQVHTEGRAVVSSGPREQMEVDVQAMHSYGLWATLEQEGR
ncbi:ATP-dependent Clp protease adapter ClpS [Georgenia sp. SYP-B2076]|uniref:ATP-dependent Clp protease adapter ClpS n=1 Tax=Georgenia sp. SYP-B2076 TaxID=2495881 RepID=UPI001F0C51A5|nr:ATP-dependent Clp protease adapter ClpS [Georgenia sp. SYP-B2076]